MTDAALDATPSAGAPTGDRPLTVGLLALAVGVISIPWSGHVDDVDAQFYRVLTRHLVEDHTWINLRFLPALFPAFREHVPFGFWPWVVADRLFGEQALGPVSALFTLATLYLVLRLGRRLGGNWVAVPAAVVLIATDSFLLIGGRSRLDPLLYLLTTASMFPVLADPQPRLRRWMLGALLAAGGALVKGPFGLLPFAAATTAAALQLRSWRWLLAGSALTLAAAGPLVAFLLYERTFGDPTWWTAYVDAQLLASARGARPTGHRPWIFPFQTLLTRFWPGLPLVALGIWPVLRRWGSPAQLRLTLATALILAGLVLPGRKVWNHVLIAYPLLGLLAGFGAAPLLRRLVAWRPGILPAARRSLPVLAAVALALSVVGAGRWFFRPCVLQVEFAGPLAQLRPGDRIAVLAHFEPWAMVSMVAAETPFWPEPTRTPAWSAAMPLYTEPARMLDWSVETGPPAMLVRDDATADIGPPPPPWRLAARARGWSLLLR